MYQMAIHFVDPTIPGLSGRDLLLRAGQALRWAGIRRARDLRGLDRHQLQDLGLDRSKS